MVTWERLPTVRCGYLGDFEPVSGTRLPCIEPASSSANRFNRRASELRCAEDCADCSACAEVIPADRSICSSARSTSAMPADCCLLDRVIAATSSLSCPECARKAANRSCTKALSDTASLPLCIDRCRLSAVSRASAERWANLLTSTTTTQSQSPASPARPASTAAPPCASSYRALRKATRSCFSWGVNPMLNRLL